MFDFRVDKHLFLLYNPNIEHKFAEQIFEEYMYTFFLQTEYYKIIRENKV